MWLLYLRSLTISSSTHHYQYNNNLQFVYSYLHLDDILFSYFLRKSWCCNCRFGGIRIFPTAYYHKKIIINHKYLCKYLGSNRPRRSGIRSRWYPGLQISKSSLLYKSIENSISTKMLFNHSQTTLCRLSDSVSVLRFEGGNEFLTLQLGGDENENVACLARSSCSDHGITYTIFLPPKSQTNWVDLLSHYLRLM